MAAHSSHRSRAWLFLAALAIALVVAATLAWRQRTELLRLALERALAGSPVAVQRISGFEPGAEGVQLTALDFTVETPTGTLAVSAEGVGAAYRLGADEITAITVRRARLGFGYRAGGGEAVDRPSGRGAVPLPLRRMQVESLVIEADTPWGRSRFSGEGELARRDDGTVAVAIQDGSQFLHAEFPPDFAAATLSVESKPRLAVAELRAEGLARPDRRLRLRADAQPLLGWLAASTLVPDRLRKDLSEQGLTRIAPILAGLELQVAADSSDGFRNLRATAALRKGKRSLAQADFAMTSVGAIDGNGQLDLPAAEWVEWLRPLLPEAAKAWKIGSGNLKGAARLSRKPAGTLTATARMKVESLVIEADTPWGRSRFSGEGELVRRDDGTVAVVIQDGSQSIHAEFPPDFAAATLSVESKPRLAVAELRAEGLARPDRRLRLRADAQPLLGWLVASTLVPNRLRDVLSEQGLTRIAPILAGLEFQAAADSSDGFRSLRATAALRKGKRSLAQADLAMTSAGAIDGNGQLDLPAAEWAEWLRPLLPEAAKAWKIGSGNLKGAARLSRKPVGTFTVTARLNASDLAVAAGTLRVEGARVEFRVDDPFAPAAVATVFVPRFQVGEAVEADELALEASLQGRELNLMRASLHLFGGALELEPVRVELDQRPIPLTVRVREVDLSRLLAALSQPGLSGSGKVSGVLPFRLTPDSIELEEGRLNGTGPGVLRYRGPAAEDNLAFQALRNFLYRQLRAQVEYRPSGDYRLTVRLEGHNPEMLAGHPIAFNLNLSGQLPELLRQGILAGDFGRPVLELYLNTQAAPKPGRGDEPPKPPPADRRNR